MPPKLFLFCLILFIKIANLNGVDDEEGKYKEMAHSEKFEPNSKDCEGIRKYWMKAKEEWKEKYYNMEGAIANYTANYLSQFSVPFPPFGVRNCFLYNISAGIRDKETLKQMPPSNIARTKIGNFGGKIRSGTRGQYGNGEAIIYEQIILGID
jgi:hypothetical protein